MIAVNLIWAIAAVVAIFIICRSLEYGITLNHHNSFEDLTESPDLFDDDPEEESLWGERPAELDLSTATQKRKGVAA